MDGDVESGPQRPAKLTKRAEVHHGVVIAEPLKPVGTQPQRTISEPVMSQRALGRFPPAHLKKIYEVELQHDTFRLSAEALIIAGRNITMGHRLGYIQGFAYNFDTGAEGIVQLAHDVYLDQNGSEGNLLQHIGVTLDETLVNVSMDAEGLHFCTRNIAIDEPFRLLERAPIPRIKTVDTEDWLCECMRHAWMEKAWFRVPTALLDDQGVHSLPFSVTLGGIMTFMPTTLALAWELLVQYENISPDTVASINVDGSIIHVPCNECLVFPATFVSSVLHLLDAKEVKVRILSRLPMNATTLSKVEHCLQAVIHTDSDASGSCREMKYVRHFAQKLPTTPEDDGLHAKPCNKRLHNLRPDLPFKLVSPPTSLDGFVEARQSSLSAAGTGLFAKYSLSKGSFVTSYGGSLLHRHEWNEYKQQYPHLTHFGLAIMNGQGCANYIIDGFMNYGTSLGRFANEPDHPLTPNVYTTWVKTSGGRLGSTEYGYIAFMASRDIAVGEEIYSKYGAGYVRDW